MLGNRPNYRSNIGRVFYDEKKTSRSKIPFLIKIDFITKKRRYFKRPGPRKISSHKKNWCLIKEKFLTTTKHVKKMRKSVKKRSYKR